VLIFLIFAVFLSVAYITLNKLFAVFFYILRLLEWESFKKGVYEKVQELIGQKDQEGGDRAGSASDLSTIYSFACHRRSERLLYQLTLAYLIGSDRAFQCPIYDRFTGGVFTACCSSRRVLIYDKYSWGFLSAVSTGSKIPRQYNTSDRGLIGKNAELETSERVDVNWSTSASSSVSGAEKLVIYTPGAGRWPSDL